MTFLGRGGSESCKVPKLVDKLEDVFVERVYCGAQFSVVLTRDGEVYSWGKGEHFRLGHGGVDHFRYPKKVEGLANKKVKNLAVGSMHVLAYTQDREIYGWGRNEQGQLGDLAGTYIVEPTCLTSLRGRQIGGMACGPSQGFIWSTNNSWTIEPQIQFVVDPTEHTLQHLNSILDKVWSDIDGEGCLPPSRDKECIAVSTLNLLKLQIFSLLSHNFDIQSLGVAPGQKLLLDLKQKIVTLASHSGVQSSIQAAAQSVLQMGWSLLLPTADERARALSALLPTESSSVPSGRKFMADLLVFSLTADGGLENALETAINMEMSSQEKTANNFKNSRQMKNSDFVDRNSSIGSELISEQARLEMQTKRTAEEKKLENEKSLKDQQQPQQQPIALLNLVKKLLRTSTSMTIAQLNNSNSSGAPSSENSPPVNSLNSSNSNCPPFSTTSKPVEHITQKYATITERSPSLSLLLRFQRLLISRIVSIQTQLKNGELIEGACTTYFIIHYLIFDFYKRFTLQNILISSMLCFRNLFARSRITLGKVYLFSCRSFERNTYACINYH